MTALFLYIIALFLLGLGNAVVTYHILRYRDQGDISVFVLAAYYGLVFLIVIGTAVLVDWNELFAQAVFT